MGRYRRQKELTIQELEKTMGSAPGPHYNTKISPMSLSYRIHNILHFRDFLCQDSYDLFPYFCLHLLSCLTKNRFFCRTVIFKSTVAQKTEIYLKCREISLHFVILVRLIVSDVLSILIGSSQRREDGCPGTALTRLCYNSNHAIRKECDDGASHICPAQVSSDQSWERKRRVSHLSMIKGKVSYPDT